MAASNCNTNEDIKIFAMNQCSTADNDLVITNESLYMSPSEQTLETEDFGHPPFTDGWNSDTSDSHEHLPASTLQPFYAPGMEPSDSNSPLTERDPKKFQQLVKQLSDEVESQSLHTQRAVIVSIHASLFPETRMATNGKTLQGLYDRLSSSRKYCSHSDCIFHFIVVTLLSLTMKDSEQQILKEHADSESKDILEFKEIKFIDFINFLSYEPKERLINANILPESARGSTEDAAEIISGLIQTGHIAPTSASLINLSKSIINNEPYKIRIKQVLDALAWTATKATTAIVTSFGNPIEPGSPKLPENPSSMSLGTLAHSSGCTAPIVKSSDTLAGTAGGDEHVSSPTIKELAVFPSLGDTWEDLGIALSIDEETLQSINKKFPNLVRKQRELFRAYLKTNPTPTWSDIINALVRISKEDIARKVIDAFNLSPELLVVAQKSTKASRYLEARRVESDAAHLVPARVSKTKVHSSTPAKSFSSDKPLPKHRIESDDGVALSAKVTADSATVTPMFTRISKTELFSPKKFDRPVFDPSEPRPKQPRVVSDDGGGASPVEETDSDLQMVERDSASLPPDDDRELKSIQMHFSSDPISDRIEHSSVSNREQSFSNMNRQSSEDNSPSSEDFHSAEETPLNSEKTAESDKYQQIVSGSQLSHQGRKRLREAVMSRNTEEINLRISENVTILNSVLETTSGQTALHIAAKLGFKDVAKVLLQHKASVTVSDSNGCTPLYLAASSGNYEIAKLIIASPERDMNTRSKDGTPLLYDPASKGFSMICELLLENGANPLTETRTGVSPLYIASRNGHKDVVRILLKFGADVMRISAETSKPPLQEAIDNEHTEVVKLLMQALSEINKKNDKLFECATAERVHELIKHGANVDARKANGSTPLVIHSSAGNKEVVQALIEEKANVDIQDNDGCSALMVASRNGHIETVRSLIYAGAIPDLKDKAGLTALMCATLAAHINVIKELLLAKADPMLKRKDGKSAMEIAEQYGNQEIIATLKRHTTSASSGNDPLYNLLGSYLELKKAKASEKQQAKNGEKIHMTAALKRRELLSSLLPKSPGATAKDDTSTAKQELEKCYKRIADLETRIHDLTLQASVEVPVETDLAHLERRRLEDEYTKLKELKRKAELYAVEAKQTAQRLSAENAKLREELNKERKYNEITRANIIREFESKASHDTMGGEKLTTKMEVLEQEIQERAYQFLRRMPQDKGSLKRVELKAVEIKEVIFEKRVAINCLELAVMGLPLSGKTELLCQMLELNVDGAKQSSSLSLHQVVVCHNQYDDSHTLIKSTGEDCRVQPVSTALAKTLVCMHKTSSLSSCMSTLVEPSSTVEEFSDFSVNHHFKAVLENVQKVALQLEGKGSLDMLMTSSLSILNLLNTKVGRIAYEISCALASRTGNLLILNLLNLERHSPENFPSLADGPGEQSSGIRSTKFDMIKAESALHCFMNAAYVASRNCKGKSPSIIMIGTHKDKLSHGKLKEVKKSLEQITVGYAESVGVADVICPGMECINTKDPNDCQRLQKRIIKLVNQEHNFQYNIPISYLFLLSYLQSLNQMFISRKKLIEIAHTCGLINEDDIEEFLHIFNSCGSLIYSNDDEISTLKDYIILNPYNFIKALNKLDSIQTMSFSDKLELFEQVNDTRLGFISENMAAYLWPGEGEGRMTQAHFYLSLLKELKIILPTSLLHLETDFGKANLGKLYYMPMLRADYDATEVQRDSNSLIITHNNAVLPFRLQTDMLLQIQNQFGTTVTFDPKPYYNTTCFRWQDSPQEKCETNIIICFHTELVEISVQFPNQAPRISTVTKIYSQLKTACVQTFQLLSTQVKTLKYEFMLVCPHVKENIISHSTPGKGVHFIQFHPLMAGEESFFCQACQIHVPSEKLPWGKSLWTQVAYQGPIKDISNHEGHLTNEQITLVCQSLAGRLNLNTIDNFATQLKSSGSKEEAAITGHPFTALESLLHFLIFTWKSRNPVNSVESLAKILHTCGCYQEALRLDPLLVSNSTKAATSQESSPSLSDKEWSAIATYLPQSTMKQLLSSTTKSGSSSQREGIAREGIIRKLSELEYRSLAVALEIGWFL